METHRAPPHRNGTHKHHHKDDSGGGGVDGFECSGRSCAAAIIADCVALCCCPCAVVNFLAFALVKVPWAVGRRCLGAEKRKRKKKKKKETTTTKEIRRKRGLGMGYDSDGEVVDEDEGSRKRWWREEGVLGTSPPSEEGVVEAERVWLELYQIGHLGFGRLSFTGMQPQHKGN